jgi:hypothetical protein
MATHPKELTASEMRTLVEEQTRRYLGMSRAAFLRAAREGKLPDHPAVAHLLILTGARSGQD